MKKIFKILITILSINLFANTAKTVIPLKDTIKSQIEISSDDFLSFFSKEIEYALSTQNISKEKKDKITKQISSEITKKFPTYKTALSLTFFIDDTLAPIFKKTTEISLSVNKVKIEKNKFILVLDCEIKKNQYLKWTKHKLGTGAFWVGKKIIHTVFDHVKPLIKMYIWTYYIYPRIYKYLLNNPNLALRYLWLKTLYNIYSEPVEYARYILSWIPLVYRLGVLENNYLVK